jgi:hypothetical protein
LAEEFCPLNDRTLGDWRRHFDDAMRRGGEIRGNIPKIRTGGRKDMNTKRRQALLLSALGMVGVMLLVIAPAGRLAAEPPAVLVQWPDTIYVNAKIVTFDDTAVNDNPGSIVEAMAVRDQKIIALGSKNEVLALKGTDTEVVDLQGKTVLPGFVHGHNHIFGPAEEASAKIFGLANFTKGYYMNMTAERTADEILAKLEKAVNDLRQVADVGEDDWIGVQVMPDADKGFPSIASVSNLGDSEDLKDAAIGMEDLSRISPDRMLILGSGYNVGPRKLKKENTWYHVTAGSDGRQMRKEIFTIEWEPRKY